MRRPRRNDGRHRELVGRKRSLGIPASIRAAGVDEMEFLTKVDTLARNAFDDQCTGANPRYPLIAELKELYLTAYQG